MSLSLRKHYRPTSKQVLGIILLVIPLILLIALAYNIATTPGCAASSICITRQENASQMRSGLLTMFAISLLGLPLSYKLLRKVKVS